MKNHKAKKLAMIMIGVGWLRNGVLVKALHLRRAAQRDERHGFPYTAATEWRQAAELFAPNTLASEYCWRQWERIMLLPRRLSGSLSVSVANVVPLKAASAKQPHVLDVLKRNRHFQLRHLAH
jgi:hypothetical protein